NGVEVLHCGAEALPATAGVFDVMTCLWNVLAHVDTRAQRLTALRRMASMLAPGGRLFLDVHNRYNMATAGRLRVAGRLLRDYLRPGDANGVVSFTWTAGGILIPATGYLFAPPDMPTLFDDAGLAVVQCAWVNYADGSPAGRWSGQMLFALERPT
ncbi:MAG: class I SAM-dependent methyltransferase, partial [Vicinamibacterales bacterium]